MILLLKEVETTPERVGGAWGIRINSSFVYISANFEHKIYGEFDSLVG